MRVCHLLNEFWFGGIQETVYELCRALPGIRHSILGHTDGPMRPLFDRLPDVETSLMPRGYPELLRYVLEHRIDVVHKQLGGGDTSSFLFPLRRPDRVCAVVESMHCPRDCKTPPDVVDVVLVASQYTLSQQTGVHPMVKVIPYGIEPVLPTKTREEILAVWGIPPTSRVVGRIGRLSGSKLVHETIETVLYLWHQGMSDIRCVIGGTIPRDEGFTYATQLRRYDQYPVCHFVGEARSHDEKANWIAALDLVCYPTQGEGFGMVFLEAIHQRIPIASYDTGANAEVIGPAGRCVPYTSRPGRIEALAKTVKEMLVPAQYRKYQRGCDRQRAYYTATRYASDVLAVYQEVLG